MTTRFSAADRPGCGVLDERRRRGVSVRLASNEERNIVLAEHQRQLVALSIRRRNHSNLLEPRSTVPPPIYQGGGSVTLVPVPARAQGCLYYSTNSVRGYGPILGTRA